jgi:hypothetical protein
MGKYGTRVFAVITGGYHTRAPRPRMAYCTYARRKTVDVTNFKLLMNNPLLILLLYLGE